VLLRHSFRLTVCVFLFMNLSLFAQTPLGTAFTYQGQLKQSSSPANGPFNMVFKLWNDPTLSSAANQIGPTLFPPPVSVTDGLFSVQLDFGQSAFNGDKRWLEITVSGTPLSPRQELTPAPHARFSAAPWATSGANISNVNAGNVGIGTAAPAQKLSVAGTIESTSGGFKFPDGTSQNTAATLPWSSTNLLSAWGENSDGQTIVPSGSFIAVAAGVDHSLAIRSDSTLAGWGWNGYGQTDVPAGTFTAVAGGYYHSLGIRTDGTLAAWGDNSSGQITVPAGTFIAVAAGEEHSLGLRSDGTLAGWGYNGQGQINVPVGTFVALASGSNHGLAIRSNGTLVGWGDNGDGQINVPAGTFIAVAGGVYHSLAIRTDGTLVGWGYNSSGQIDVPAGTFTAVKAGYAHGLAIRTDGTVAAWGGNYSGQTDAPTRQCIAIAAGDSHSLGIFPGISLDGGFEAGPSAVQGTLSVQGEASILGKLTVDGDAEIHQDASITGRLGVGTSHASSRLEVQGGVKARQGTPGSFGSDNNGFSFSGFSGDYTGMYSLVDDQLNFYTGFSEKVRITSNGDVGIGTTSPTTKLYVNGGFVATSNAGIGTSSPACRLHIVGGSDSSLAGGGYIQTGNTLGENLSIDSNEMMARNNGAPSALFFNHDGGNVIIADAGAGNLGIGTANPAQKLHVIGNICATGSIGACSDGRFKKNVRPLGDALAMVERLSPVRFDWKRDEFPEHHFDDSHQIGFIAQEAREVLPEIVAQGSDGYLSVDYGRLTPVIVEALKQIKREKDTELAAIRSEKDAQINELRTRLDRLERVLENLPQEKNKGAQ
jgi:hypothetical protein